MTVLAQLHVYNLGVTNACVLVAIHNNPNSSPAEIQKLLAQQQVSLSRNAIYQAVSRLFERKLITQENKPVQQGWRMVVPSYYTRPEGATLAKSLNL